MEKLIYRFLSGEADANEQRKVREWIMKSEENARTFAKIKNLYVRLSIKEERASDEDTTLFMNRIRKRKSSKKIYRQTGYGVAAVLLLFLFSYAVYTLGTKEYKKELNFVKSQQIAQYQYYTPSGVKGKVILPDSSVVWLNSESSISYPSKFSGTIRKVAFSGEGYFEIKKNPERPMNITLKNGMSVNVKGTTFNLTAYDNDKTYSIFLISGQISLLNDRSKELYKVEPNQKIYIEAGTNKISVHKPEDIMPTIGWKRGWLVFEETGMEDIINKMERWYGVRIAVKDSAIMSKTLTARFREESLSQVLSMMHQISLVNYTIKDSLVTLEKFR